VRLDRAVDGGDVIASATPPPAAATPSQPAAAGGPPAAEPLVPAPEPDDEFAKGVGEGFASLTDLKDRLRSDIRERQESQAEESYRDAALTALVEQAGVIEFPPVLVEREIDRFLNDQARNTGMELDRYLELIKKTPEEVREELRPSATERVKRSLVLGQLADTEKIETTEADIEAEVQKLIAQASGGDDEQVELYVWCERRYGHVSYERVCSGIGLPNLYAFLWESGRVEQSERVLAAFAVAREQTPVICEEALRPDPDPACAAAVSVARSRARSSVPEARTTESVASAAACSAAAAASPAASRSRTTARSASAPTRRAISRSSSSEAIVAAPSVPKPPASDTAATTLW